MVLTLDPRSNDGPFVAHMPSTPSGKDFDDLAAVIKESEATGAALTLWAHDVNDETDALIRSCGLRQWRDLWQLRCDLPATKSTIATRAFTDGDLERFVAVNNRAFSWHPEQSGLTVDAVRETMREPWFNSDGFRLYEIDEQLLGFCWTKVHTDLEPPIGEIFVIAVDPSAHGQGLGTPMTLAGLDWLADQGLTRAMLYVESDNVAANATYERIGFRRHLTNRAYTTNAASS